MAELLRRTTRQHRSGNSFSVRIPREMAYPVPDQELEIEMIGNMRVLRPKRIDFEAFQAKLAAAYAAGATGLNDAALERPEWPAHRESW